MSILDKFTEEQIAAFEDCKTKEELHSLFFELRDKFGQTIIIVTHDHDLAQRSDRVVEMKDGLFI